ncbi:hypothetical protein DPMN_031299 [Dreissena polymorpha]|uniref:Uncharacterized protein n=1 Tax=Dreissena polymorpha TaxID=45954 RepID=A0A9D4M1Y4_DREPO|nr:hypothetical protein DPMN_031299 [Dreissena polymorpha]
MSESDVDSGENRRLNFLKTPEGFNSISQVLREANSVLYDEVMCQSETYSSNLIT